MAGGRRARAWAAGAARAQDRIPYGAVWVRMPRFIGDSVMIHQALEPLRAAGLPLVAWGPPAVAELFEDCGGFAGVWADGPERDSGWALSRLLRAAGARAVLNLPRSSRALLAAWMARVGLRVGWREAGGRFLANRSLGFSCSGHQLDRYRALLDLAFPGLPPASARPFRPRAASLAAAERAVQDLGLGAPRVVLALGAMACTKRLGSAVWIGLIRRLRELGIAHLMLGGPGADQAQAAEILEALPGVPDLTGRLPLSVTAGVIAQAQALVGNDSAMSHLAAASGTPALVVFGPTLPEATAPRGPGVRILRREDLPCIGCHNLICAVPGHPCMDAFPAERIAEALVTILSH